MERYVRRFLTELLRKLIRSDTTFQKLKDVVLFKFIIFAGVLVNKYDKNLNVFNGTINAIQLKGYDAGRPCFI